MRRDGAKRVVFVGGGSIAWMPTLIRDFLVRGELSNSQFVFLDVNRTASDVVCTFASQLAQRLHVGATFISTDDQAAALEGADYVIITITTGGLDAMGHDLSISEEFGIYHTVGDTCGPAAWSRLLRNFEIFRGLAEDINTFAPGAVVINYTNPLATLTMTLSNICKGPVIGLCHGLLENLEFLGKLYNAKSDDDVSVSYAGLNHFFWTTNAKVAGRDVLPDLRARIQHESFETMVESDIVDPMGYSSGREVATELFRLTGMLPYLAGRHTCEFVPWYITQPLMMDQYKLRRTTIADRKGSLGRARRWLEEAIRDGVADAFLRPSKETAAQIVEAHACGRDLVTVGNTPNSGQITNVRPGVVVETAVRVDGNGFAPVSFGPLPQQIAALVEPWAFVYEMQVDACFAADRRLALTALRLDPLCGHLSTAKVESMATAMLNANERYHGGGL